MSSKRLTGGKVVRISEYLKEHPNEDRKRNKRAKAATGADDCTELPHLSASVALGGDVAYGIENATPFHARPLLLAALSMCIDLVLLRDGLT